MIQKHNIKGREGTSRFVGIDPGIMSAAVFISKDHYYDAWQVDHYELVQIETAYQRFSMLLEDMREHRYAIEIEDFIGGGLRSRHAGPTYKLIGFVEGWCVTHNYPLSVKVPQTRLPYINEAKAMLMRYEIENVTHLIDATAHALACADRFGMYDRTKE